MEQEEGRRMQPGCSMIVDLLAVLLSNSPELRAAGGREQRMMRVKKSCFLTEAGVGGQSVLL